MRQENIMYYKTPPKEWMEGLPSGNGCLAQMVYGEDYDIISLNHENLWRGVTKNRDVTAVPPEVFGQLRDLYEQKEYFMVTALSHTWFSGKGGQSGIDNRIDSFQPAGDICFDLDGEKSFVERRLSLSEGFVTVKRCADGKEVTLTSFTDINENKIINKWSGDGFSGKLSFSRPVDENAKESVTYKENEILYFCEFDGGISYKAKIVIKTDGQITATDKNITIKNATRILTITDIIPMPDNKDIPFTDFDYDFEKSFENHKKSFREYTEKFDLWVDLPENNNPTDERLNKIRQGETDDSLMLLFYNFGIYLFISSSIKGQLPANLQGKWNAEINPPWASDYHLNINLQMNYWLAEPLGLGDCADKLLNLIDKMVPYGKVLAKKLWNSKGVYFGHATDIWGRPTPESYGYGAWTGAASWLAQHYHFRYIYSGDKEFLKNRAYPFFKEVALFYQSMFYKDKDGVFQILPSSSPENAYDGAGHFCVSVSKSAAMEIQLAYDSLGYAIDSAEILGVDRRLVKKWKNLRKNLPEFKIGSDGRLLEWDDEKIEKNRGHRHLSHLYGLYPSDIFSEDLRPMEFEACKKSLNSRMESGGGHTGWSRAWVACLYGRLGNGEKLYEHIFEMLKEFATVSLLDLHPPRIFQIDGNLGAVAALTESVAQFRNGKLYLLHSLPDKWKKGEINGYKTPGGHTVSFKWEDKKITDFHIDFGFADTLKVVINGEEKIYRR